MRLRDCSTAGIKMTAHLYALEQSKQILGLISQHTACVLRVPSAVFGSLFYSCSGYYSSVKGNIKSTRNKFDRILTNGLVEIRIQFLYEGINLGVENRPRAVGPFPVSGPSDAAAMRW